MVAKKIVKKTAVAKSAGVDAPAKKVTGKKVTVKKVDSRKTVAGLKADQARMAEAHALLAKRAASGKPLSTKDILVILGLLGEIISDIQQIIILLTSDH